ncbi:MAG: GntG family PLP-dependent aldolase [bacterium]|nr:GntG family PLP-dependent aldolase [bacterium]
MRISDFRSDTVTKPTEEMYEAMMRAPLGDDVLGDDPTVIELERLAAEKTGFESALFVPSGTMGNAIAVRAWAKDGTEVILEEMSHIYTSEVGHIAYISRAIPRPLKSKRGIIDPEDIRKAIRKEELHRAGTSLVCLENTHNYWGGKSLPPDYVAEVSAICKEHGLPLHMDGARIFNACTHLKVDVKEYTKHLDSLMFCLSKGLSAPVGSMLCGTKEFIEKARRIRKLLGGGMRQAGILAACGIVAIQKMIDRLEEDHKNAKKLAEGLSKFPFLKINPDEVETNIVIAETKVDPQKILSHLQSRGILALQFGPGRIRFVTHKDVNEEDVERLLKALGDFRP